MKYRIKIITYANGRKTYTAQVKRRFGWVYLNSEGGTTSYDGYDFAYRENALKLIDLHFAGNTKKQTIEFEYITKGEGRKVG